MVNNKKISQKYFDKEASAYSQTSDGKYCNQMYSAVLAKVDEHPYQSVLDLGCGTGTLLLALTVNPSIRSCGIDISERMIEVARFMLKDKPTQLMSGDSEHIPWDDDSFDLVICNAAFHHFPNPLNVLKEIRRVMMNGGRLILADPWWTGFKRAMINWFLRTPLNYLGDVSDIPKDTKKSATNCLRSWRASWDVSIWISQMSSRILTQWKRRSSWIGSRLSL